MATSGRIFSATAVAIQSLRCRMGSVCELRHFRLDKLSGRRVEKRDGAESSSRICGRSLSSAGPRGSQEAIFHDDADRERFLLALGQVCARTGWRVHAFVLMSNHYHLLVETPEANLVAGMRWFQSTYTMRFNRRHGLKGHLFQGRYKAMVVDPEERSHLVTLSDYVHLNPIRARMISLRERLYDYPWSSYRLYATRAGRPEWFEPGRVLAACLPAQHGWGRRRYAERMRRRAVEELQGENTAQSEGLQRGWCLGGTAFRERMLGLLESAGEKLSRKKEVDGVIRQNHGEEEARRLLERVTSYLGLHHSELAELKRNDPRSVDGAADPQPHERSNCWIARELSLGHVSSVSRYSALTNADGEPMKRLAAYLEEAERRN